MNPRILQFFPNADQEHLHPLRAPAQIPSEQSQAVRLQTLERSELLESSELLELLVACPGTQRDLFGHHVSESQHGDLHHGTRSRPAYLINITPNIHEARVPHPAFEQIHAVHLLPELLRRLVQPLLILDAVGGEFLERAVVAVQPHLVLLRFHPAAGFEMPQCLTVEFGPVADGAAEAATVDIVEGSVVGPFGLGVIDFEFDVWWDPNAFD